MNLSVNTIKATQAQSFERRWRRVLTNKKINTEHIYLPLVMAALSKWKNQGSIRFSCDWITYDTQSVSTFRALGKIPKTTAPIAEYENQADRLR